MRARAVVLVVIAAMLLSSCEYLRRAYVAEQNGDPVPWWCAPSEDDVRVTDGPASGTVDWYVGVQKAPLSNAQCKNLSSSIDAALAYAKKWPTEGQAEADGWTEATPYVPGGQGVGQDVHVGSAQVVIA